MPKEWNWEERSPEFWQDFVKSDGDYIRKLSDVEWRFTDRVLWVDNVVNGKPRKPLHPNLRLLLETIRQLQPMSVAEFGCGFGDNLYNTGRLLPDAILYGYDISQFCLDCLRQRSPLLRVALQSCDIGVVGGFIPVELVYTSVVIMHIIGDRHLTALRNMFETALRHVVLMENWGCYPFMEDIKNLHNDNAFTGWHEMHFYYRYSVEFARPHLMIVSKDGDLPYERLYDYNTTLCQPLAKAAKEGRP